MNDVMPGVRVVLLKYGQGYNNKNIMYTQFGGNFKYTQTDTE